MTDGIHKVSFSYTHPSPNKKWVVRFPQLFCHRIRCRHKGFQFLAPEGTTDEQIMDALIEGYRCTLSPRRPATPQARPSAQASCT